MSLIFRDKSEHTTQINKISNVFLALFLLAAYHSLDEGMNPA